MAFSLSTFLLAVFMLLGMLARFFNGMDEIVIISDPALTLTCLDLACVTILFYTIYDFKNWATAYIKRNGS